MAISAKWYGNGQLHLARARVDLLNDTIKVSLHTSAYTPNQDTHDFFDDATNEIANGNGYTTGGIALANKTVTYDGPTNELRFDADDIEWTLMTATFRYAVVRKARGGAASADELLGYVDHGGDEAPVSATFRMKWDVTGVLKLAAA